MSDESWTKLDSFRFHCFSNLQVFKYLIKKFFNSFKNENEVSPNIFQRWLHWEKPVLYIEKIKWPNWFFGAPILKFHLWSEPIFHKCGRCWRLFVVYSLYSLAKTSYYYPVQPANQNGGANYSSCFYFLKHEKNLRHIDRINNCRLFRRIVDK